MRVYSRFFIWTGLLRSLAAAALLAAIAVPLAASVGAALKAAWAGPAWPALANDPQTVRALCMSLWTGLASTLLAVAATARILAHSGSRARWDLQTRRWAPMLALPHVALAIGLGLWIAPSGWLLRALSPWATGLTEPPPWPTTQDPWGLGLITVLVLKEVPFLLWAAAGYLQRPDVARRLQQELALARSLGYHARAAWWKIAWPQLWPRLTGPLLAVLAYSLTVVDVALVIGPTSPPTLAVLAWQWLQDAAPQVQAQGAAAGWLLVAVIAGCAGLTWTGGQMHYWRKRRVMGWYPAAGAAPAPATPGGIAHILPAVYTAVALALLAGSVFGNWTFPALWPDNWTWSAWQSVAANVRSVTTTVWLALASALSALLWSLAWLELAPARWHMPVRYTLALALVLPGVLWVVGLHRLALVWGVDASAWGLWMAHSLAALPYVMLVLQGPYTAVDPRLRQVAASLGRGHGIFLLRIKWPLLRGALAAALAVGFAVSVAQYLPTLYIGAGRFATVTTEAVTLAAGAQRSLAAAYAGLQWLLPALMFAFAARAGRVRRFRAGYHPR